MERRDFLKLSGVGMGTLALPITGNGIAAEQLVLPLGLRIKKQPADAALSNATGAGAAIANVRERHILIQIVVTRERKVTRENPEIRVGN